MPDCSIDLGGDEANVGCLVLDTFFIGFDDPLLDVFVRRIHECVKHPRLVQAVLHFSNEILAAKGIIVTRTWVKLAMKDSIQFVKQWFWRLPVLPVAREKLARCHNSMSTPYRAVVRQ